MSRKAICNILLGKKIEVSPENKDNFAYICKELGIRNSSTVGCFFFVTDDEGKLSAQTIPACVYRSLIDVDHVDFDDLYIQVCAIARAHYRPCEVCTAVRDDGTTIQFSYIRPTSDGKFILGIGMNAEGKVTGECFRYTVSKVRRATEFELHKFAEAMASANISVDYNPATKRVVVRRHIARNSGKTYYAIILNVYDKTWEVVELVDEGSANDDRNYARGNYFLTPEAAEKVLNTL